MTKRNVFATAAAVFAVSTLTTAARADVVCAGVNACKGQSACKGKGFIMTGSSFECTVIKENK